MYESTKSKQFLFIIMMIVGSFVIGILAFGNNKQTPVQADRVLTNERKADLPALSGEKAVNYLKENGGYRSLTAANYVSLYNAEKKDDKVFASNPGNQLTAEFDETGFNLKPSSKDARWKSEWRLRSFGFGKEQTSVSADGEVASSGQRVEIRRKEMKLVEWFENKPEGLEHGFTLAERPATNQDKTKPLRLVMEVGGDLIAKAEKDGQSLVLNDADGKKVLRYEKLKVWDANRKEQTARMKVEDRKVYLEVEEANAKYPLTIDPTFIQQAKLNASDGASGEEFGISVAISGDTAIVGATYDNDNGVNSGSAYVYKRNGTEWTEQAKLTASDGAVGDSFGLSVAISGDTVIIGAVFDDGSAGSAYVFERNGTVWAQQAKLTASDRAAGDYFGYSVTISGDTAIVGANFDNNNGVTSGSAYIYERSGTVWGQQAKLTASDGAAGDQFGVSVAISGDTAIIGAHVDDNFAGSAYVYKRNGTEWTEQAKLTASDRAAYDSFGNSVAISGDTAIVGAYSDDASAGSAYVYKRNGTEWAEQAKLTASDRADLNQFGLSVTISGDTVIVGAPSGHGDSGFNSGRAYVYIRIGTVWSQQTKLTASDGAAGAQFGRSVAISGETAILGAHNSDGNESNSGSAYIFAVSSNAAPTIVPNAVSVSADSSVNQTVAFVSDPEDDDGDLTVSVDGPSSSNGVSISNLAVDSFGSVSAGVGATCGATDASFSLKVTDSGSLMGTATLNITVTRETQAPVIAPVADVEVYLPLNSTAISMVVSFDNPTATDNCDANPTVTASPSSGSTFPVGETTVTVDAVDDAGNNAAPVTFKVRVHYNFSGFLNPVSVGLNHAKAGSGVQVKFSLSGSKGLGVLKVGYPVSYQIPCSGSGSDGVEIPTETSGSSSLSYDALTDQYKYVWKSSKDWKGSCRRLVVKLNDGSFHTADFQFK